MSNEFDIEPALTMADCLHLGVPTDVAVVDKFLHSEQAKMKAACEVEQAKMGSARTRGERMLVKQYAARADYWWGCFQTVKMLRARNCQKKFGGGKRNAPKNTESLDECGEASPAAKPR